MTLTPVFLPFHRSIEEQNGQYLEAAVFGGGGNRTRVLVREIQAPTGLAVYWIVRSGLG